ncbi:MAG: hypothetical protein ACUVUC_08170 [Thermoguttaceae bacterium]
MFIPDTTKGTQGPPAVGATDQEGRFELATRGTKGAAIGFHKVKLEARRAPKSQTESQPPSLIPLRYSNPETSKLSFEVKKVAKGEKNELSLPLTSKP